eukprot:gene11242-23508_t
MSLIVDIKKSTILAQQQASSVKLNGNFQDSFNIKCPNVKIESIQHFPEITNAEFFCHNKWIKFRSLQNLTASDLLLPPPHQVRQDENTKKYFYSNSDTSSAIKIKDDVCFAKLDYMFIGPMGGIFDCRYQYPLMLHRSGLFHSIVKKTPAPRETYFHKHLISLTFRANDFFSHAFSVGISIAAWSLHILQAPAAILGFLDQFIDPIEKTVKKKPTATASDGSEPAGSDRSLELTRTALKAVLVINDVEDVSTNRRWQEFMERISKCDRNGMILETLRHEKTTEF